MKHGSMSFLVCALVLTGCIKEELPVPAQPPGPARIGQACVGSDYADQVWYDLGTNSAVSVNSKMDWDLAFECGADGWRVRLNTSRFMRALPLSSTEFALPLDTSGFGPQWRIDASSAAPDSTAIGDWRSGLPVIVVDLGYNAIGLPMGVRQLRMLSVDATTYSFQIAQMNGSGVQTFTIDKDPSRSYVHWRLSSGQVVPIGPPLGAYDLVFTQYTRQFYDPYTAYLVTGTLTGFSGARVAPIPDADFGTVELADTLVHPFIPADDAIGYDWKEYDFDLGVYTLQPSKVYIVQDRAGSFYKLHFTDFYNELGVRGCPTFEVVDF